MYSPVSVHDYLFVSHTPWPCSLTCRYEGLRATLYELQKKLMSLTGEDPLKDKGVSIIAPQFSPRRGIARSPDGMYGEVVTLAGLVGVVLCCVCCTVCVV